MEMWKRAGNNDTLLDQLRDGVAHRSRSCENGTIFETYNKKWEKISGSVSTLSLSLSLSWRQFIFLWLSKSKNSVSTPLSLLNIVFVKQDNVLFIRHFIFHGKVTTGVRPELKAYCYYQRLFIKVVLHVSLWRDSGIRIFWGPWWCKRLIGVDYWLAVVLQYKYCIIVFVRNGSHHSCVASIDFFFSSSVLFEG